MREILFRAWDKVSKKYREFDGMHDTMMMINKDGKVEYYNLQNGSGGDEYILEQFTGLHDSTTWKELTEQERKDWTGKGNFPSEWKGRKIFEGDILEVNFNDDCCNIGKQKAIIKYSDKHASFLVEPLDDWSFCGMDEGEVIGNIHEGGNECTSAIVE